MGSLMIRIVLAIVATTMLALLAHAQNVSAAEPATAQGAISIAAAPAGLAAPRCTDLVVEARDANDNHLIVQTHPAPDADGTCKYALIIPAQSAVWLHLREALFSSTGTALASSNNAPVAKSNAPAGRAVQIRSTVISPNTYVFAPGEQKTIPLSF